MGFNSSTNIYSCICETTYSFALAGSNVVSVTGNNGNNETLMWTDEINGWRFQPGVFSFVDNGSGNIDILFFNNGALVDILNIYTIKISNVKIISLI